MKYCDIYKALYPSWFNKEVKGFLSFKRRYKHFDNFINIKGRKRFFEQYFKPKEKLSVEYHSFYPFIKVELPKYKYIISEVTGKRVRDKSAKNRDIFYASHFDSFIYSWYSTILSKLYEDILFNTSLSEIPIAYRKLKSSDGTSKCNIHFADDVFGHIQSMEESYVITLDFKSFFDTMDHGILKYRWCEILNAETLPEDHFKVYKSIINYSYVNKNFLDESFDSVSNGSHRICTPKEFREKVRDKKQIHLNENYNQKTSSRNGEKCGIPQGSPISAVLSNIYLLLFDKLLNDFALDNGDYYRRYSDDIIYISKSDRVLPVINFINNLVDEAELTLNEDKTNVVKFIGGENNLESYDYYTGKPLKLQYLGFLFDGKDCLIRSSSISKYHRKMRKGAQKVAKESLGPSAMSNRPFVKKYYDRYTEIGDNNFVSYAQKASKTLNQGTIAKQVKGTVRKSKKVLLEKIRKREERKNLPNKINTDKLH